MKTKVLSIYLPQFHTIPENDSWWGKGFTEWTNCKRGKPYYPGHYQPREPLNDNYYDLSDLRVLEKHTKLAKKAGIAGFCFYHYYFKGKTLLEKPIEKYRDSSKENFPYCLIWANQSWTRTWYRAQAGNSILIQQSYGNENDWKNHFYYLLDFFRDERYIKIDNKPLYIIYIPQDIYCRREMFSVWQKLALENGFNGLYLIAMNTSFGKDSHSDLYNAYMDFEPMCTWSNDNSWRKKLQIWKETKQKYIDKSKKSLLNYIYLKNSYTYSYLCKKIIQKSRRSTSKTYIGIFAGWDNTSRKDENGLIIRGNTPKKFGKIVEVTLSLSEKQNKKYVFLNAWNEWSEGAYIEADKKYGYAYLKALKNVIYKYERDTVNNDCYCKRNIRNRKNKVR